MIESVNSLTAPTQSSAHADKSSLDDGQGLEDPLNQIGQVLNAHLKSLYWIDNTVKEVEAKVNEAEEKVKDATGGGTSSRRLGASKLGASSLGGASGNQGLPLGQFGSMSLRASEGPRARGFGLGSSTYR